MHNSSVNKLLSHSLNKLLNYNVENSINGSVIRQPFLVASMKYTTVEWTKYFTVVRTNYSAVALYITWWLEKMVKEEPNFHS